MAQYHYVVYYDTATEEWHTDYDTTSILLSDGVVFDYAESGEWSDVAPNEVEAYVDHIADLLGYEVTKDNHGIV